MTDPNRPTDNPRDRAPEASPELARDLRALFSAAPSVPPLVDERILAQARRTMATQRRRRFLLRTVSIGAAAACLVGAIWLSRLPDRSPRQLADTPVPIATAVRAASGDINGDGRVDILDALALARHIEAGVPSGSSPQPRPSKPEIIVALGDQRTAPGAPSWDINGDGLLDRRDVDAVAYRAVSLTN